MIEVGPATCARTTREEAVGLRRKRIVRSVKATVVLARFPSIPKLFIAFFTSEAVA
jgi:hypothetical protein